MSKTGIKLGDQAPHPLRSSSYSQNFKKTKRSSAGPPNDNYSHEEREGFIDEHAVRMDDQSLDEMELLHSEF